ncbi:tail fiber assembly protein [Aeromonas veronii]|uniref:tail fiber assembly protein n=1 Tax=Aeromonas veronii TaxID=654 RepID=UPI001F3E4661|nr:tail fiber assembly protein [Aeromonas veronii]MCF5767969.1 tail fiber assembly protein [Aeromonas veronii]
MGQRVEWGEDGWASNSGWETAHITEPETGKYIGQREVWVSAGTGLPACAYLDAPPPYKDGECPVRIARSEPWVIKQDLIGMTAYNIETKGSREITELGPLRELETLLKPSSPYDAWDGFKWVKDHEAEAAAALDSATRMRSELLIEANQHIAVLGDAVELGMATEDEQAAYTAWRRYRVELTRLDLTVTPIEWPEKPQ